LPSGLPSPSPSAAAPPGTPGGWRWPTLALAAGAALAGLVLARRGRSALR
jgi:hypothetical protein